MWCCRNGWYEVLRERWGTQCSLVKTWCHCTSWCKHLRSLRELRCPKLSAKSFRFGQLNISSHWREIRLPTHRRTVVMLPNSNRHSEGNRVRRGKPSCGAFTWWQRRVKSSSDASWPNQFGSSSSPPHHTQFHHADGGEGSYDLWWAAQVTAFVDA
jgi:hypothetical protein